MNDTESILFKLPKYMFLSFCSDWISVIDFCKFDSSVTNTLFRSLYETYASSSKLLISDDGAGTSLSTKCFAWLLTRNILVKTLTAPSNVLPIKEFLLKKENKKIFNCLKSISFVHNSEVKLRNQNKGIFLAGRQEALIQSCVSLETLDISKSSKSLSAKFFESVSSHCPLLKRLIIGEGFQPTCRYRRRKVPLMHTITPTAALMVVSKGCKFLEEVSGSMSLPEEAAVSLAENCSNLRILGFHPNNNQGVNADKVLTSFGEHCAQLRKFCISGKFSESALEQFVGGCKLLTKLAISCCQSYSLTDVAIAAIATHCLHLTDLDMNQCFTHKVSMAGFGLLLGQCRALTHLCLPQRLPLEPLCDLLLSSKDNLIQLVVCAQFYSSDESVKLIVESKLKQLRAMRSYASICVTI